jgi:hypothetical protein
VNRFQLESLSAFVSAYSKNPRISTRELHRKYSHYKRRKSTSNLIRDARDLRIIIGPRIWCNSGCDIEIYEDIDDPLLLLDELERRPEVTYATALVGDFSVICFKNGASILKYAEAIIPSFPAKKTIMGISLEELGELPIDKYPHGWDELDWEVFHSMRNPSLSFAKAGEKLNTHWHTVKNHFERILPDCKVWINLFPRGYGNYQQSYVMFKTEFELGLRDELKKLDRTTMLYKFGDDIILHLFLDELLHTRVFFNLKRKGKIYDLRVSAPLGWYSAFW